jgi:hypothetical protein
MLHALSISSSSIWSFLSDFAKCTSYEAPHYAIFPNLLSPHCIQTEPHTKLVLHILVLMF